MAAASRCLLSSTSVAHRPCIRRPIISDYVGFLPFPSTWRSYHEVNFQHFFVSMKNPGGERPTKFDLIVLYIKTLGKVVGRVFYSSFSEAMKRICKVNCGGETPLGFGGDIDLVTSLKRGLHGVSHTIADRYVGPYYKDYGGEFMFINGKNFHMSLNREGAERQMNEISQPHSSSSSSSFPVSLSVKKWFNLPPKTSPWLLLPPPSDGEKQAYRFYSIAQQKEFSINHEFLDYDAKFVGSSHGWLALFNPRNNDMFLWNPLTGCNIKLPPVDTLLEGDLRDGGVRKVIVSCSPATDSKGCRLLMLYGPEYELAFCCPGHSSEWSPLFLYGECIEDIIYSPSHKLFFGISSVTDPCLPSVKLQSWDLQTCGSPVESIEFDFDFEVVKKENWGNQDRVKQLKYLVMGRQQSNPPLYVVTRHMLRCNDQSYRTFDFDVIKFFNIGGDLWYTLRSLDGLAMFIGTNHSFALPAEDYPELEGDCIYHTDENKLVPPCGRGLPDIDIFSYRLKCFYFNFMQQADVPRKKHSYIRDGCHVSRRRVPPLPMWFTPTLA